MDGMASDIIQIDTLLGGVPGVTGVHLLPGDHPALVDCGTRTSAETVRRGVEQAGIAPDDLAWLVLTHIHLDHCGAVGDLARAFPRATVVVHPRGVRHLIDPTRLVDATAAIYGRLADVIGGLEPVPEHRIVAAEEGHLVPISPGRSLRAIWAPGHARHQMALLDEARGVLFAADALGVTMGGGALHPSVPPPEYDLTAALDTLERLAALDPQTLYVSHFGAVEDPQAAIDEGARAQRAMGEAAREAWTRAPGDRDELARAVASAWPTDRALATPEARTRWLAFGWLDNNIDGLAGMVDREARAT